MGGTALKPLYTILSAIKDSFQKLSLIRSKIFENAVSRTHYEINT